MAFTYANDPTASDVAAVRFEVQDIDPNAPLFQDGEIAYSILRETGQPANLGALVLDDYGVLSSAARCCEALSRRFAAQADEVIGDVSVKYSTMAQTYALRAQELRVKAAGSSPAGPYSGGQSRSEKFGWRSDPDRVQPAFRRDQFRNPFSGTGRDLPIGDSPLDG